MRFNIAFSFLQTTIRVDPGAFVSDDSTVAEEDAVGEQDSVRYDQSKCKDTKESHGKLLSSATSLRRRRNTSAFTMPFRQRRTLATRMYARNPQNASATTTSVFGRRTRRITSGTKGSFMSKKRQLLHSMINTTVRVFSHSESGTYTVQPPTPSMYNLGWTAVLAEITDDMVLFLPNPKNPDQLGETKKRWIDITQITQIDQQ